jgi:hypothetical protein
LFLSADNQYRGKLGLQSDKNKNAMTNIQSNERVIQIKDNRKEVLSRHPVRQPDVQEQLTQDVVNSRGKCLKKKVSETGRTIFSQSEEDED